MRSIGGAHNYSGRYATQKEAEGRKMQPAATHIFGKERPPKNGHSLYYCMEDLNDLDWIEVETNELN